jgi:hypothetical protein
VVSRSLRNGVGPAGGPAKMAAMNKQARMGSIGQPFSIPSQPLRSRTTFRNPINGATVTVTRNGAFWFTFLFGCFYLAYKEAWLHAGIALLIALISGPLCLVFWFIYAFFAYRIIVDSYRRKGWIEVSPIEKLPTRGGRTGLTPIAPLLVPPRRGH